MNNQLPRCIGAGCAKCASYGLSEWATLNSDEAKALDSSKVVHRYESGETLFEQGSSCAGIYCVKSGTVATRRTSDRGDSVVLRLYHHGQTLGYEAAFRDAAHAVSAQAVEDCEVCFIDRTVFDRFLSENTDLARRFLKTTADVIEQDEKTKLNLVRAPLRTRLASVLLDLREHYGSVDDEGTMSIELPLSRRALASLLGARPETISRAIRELEEHDVVKFDSRTVIVPDLDRLFDEVDGVDPNLG